MVGGERTRVGTGGAMVPYSLSGAAQGAMRDPRATAAYYNLPQKSAQAMQQAGALFPRAGLLGGALLAAAPGVVSAAESAGEGRTLEAGVTGLGTLGGLGLGGLVASRLGGIK